MALFNKKTTAQEIVNSLKNEVKGKNILVTGVSPNSLGAEVVRVLTPYANLVIAASRNEQRTHQTIAPILVETPSANIKVVVVDLMSVESIKAAAKQIREPIHVLVNNAAVPMATEIIRTEEGFESQFGANHLGHFLLTSLLLPNLKEATSGGFSPRVINASSVAHNFGVIRFDDPNFKLRPEEYNKYVGYSQSKTANILFSLEFAKRFESMGILSYSVHPGSVTDTPMGASVPKEDLISMGLLNPDGSPADPDEFKSIAAGAATYIVAAFDPLIKGESGSYLCDAVVSQDKVATHAKDPEAAVNLWALSENLLGIKF
jgi:NAD(P)-dependent dehydrogenase (short-subunit alcohol dehydrogenase family)